jgi:hypothetical protein
MKTWLIARYIAWTYEIGEHWIAFAEMTLECSYEDWDRGTKFLAWVNRMELWWQGRVVQPFILKVLKVDSQELFDLMARYQEWKDGWPAR